jgi:hypothetical protein
LENHTVLRILFEPARKQGKKAHNVFLDCFTKNSAQAQAAIFRNRLKGRNPRRILRC